MIKFIISYHGIDLTKSRWELVKVMRHIIVSLDSVKKLAQSPPQRFGITSIIMLLKNHRFWMYIDIIKISFSICKMGIHRQNKSLHPKDYDQFVNNMSNSFLLWFYLRNL